MSWFFIRIPSTRCEYRGSNMLGSPARAPNSGGAGSETYRSFDDLATLKNPRAVSITSGSDPIETVAAQRLVITSVPLAGELLSFSVSAPSRGPDAGFWTLTAAKSGYFFPPPQTNLLTNVITDVNVRSKRLQTALPTGRMQPNALARTAFRMSRRRSHALLITKSCRRTDSVTRSSIPNDNRWPR